MILKTNNLNGKNFYFRSLKNEEHYVVKLLKLTSVDLVQAYYPSLWTSYVNTPDDSLVDTIGFIFKQFGKSAIKQGMDKIATFATSCQKYKGKLTNAKKVTDYIESIIDALNQSIPVTMPNAETIRTLNRVHVYKAFLEAAAKNNPNYGWDSVTDNSTTHFIVYDMSRSDLTINDYPLIHRLLKARYEGSMIEIYCSSQELTTYCILEKQLLFDTSFEIGNGHWSLISKSMFCDFSLDQYMLDTYNATRILIN